MLITVEILIGIILSAVAIALLFVIIMGIFFTIDVFFELPYVGAQKNCIDTIIKFASIKKWETVVDLGSGDGRLLFAAAEADAKAVGYEINPFLIALTLIRTKLKGLSNNVWVERQSLWKADLKVADVIFVYAKRKTMPKFEKFIFQNTAKGTRVVVNTNPFPNKKPQRQENGIFLYKV